MADNPWDLKTDDTRAEETVNIFVIYCEDDVSEPVYFNSFASDTLRVNAIGNQRAGHLNLQSTVAKCMEAGYMEYTAVGYRLKNMVTENLWCVYDRDLESTDPARILPENNTGWTIAIQNALDAGLKVAWSNDAFELWILLHFEDITPTQAQHRDDVYERLTEIFKSLQPGSDALKAYCSHEFFNYKGAMKKKRGFLEFVLPEVKSRTAIAIQRAVALAAAYSGDMPFHDRNPCTMVHTLVSDLLANGGK